MHDDVTKPRRDEIVPPDADLETLANGDEYDNNSGPGCIAWGLMGLFALGLAVAIVISAVLAGFNQGLDVARVTAGAATRQNTNRQCEILPTDIAAGRFQVVQSRFDALSSGGILPDCAQVYVDLATNAFVESIITVTLTNTPFPTSTPPPVIEPTTTSTPQPDNPYDLPGLLAEARASIASQSFEDAIETLDAIRAIDPNFEATTVTNLLFNALTQQATSEFRAPDGSLARGILLTNRAEQFGNIAQLDISFERSVAESYLDAQANLDVNPQLAIQLLVEVISLSTNYPRGTGRAATQLVEQYEAFGDALLLSGEACQAVQQFEAGLARSPNSVSLQSKATTASQQCSGVGVVSGTVDPNATIDPSLPTATPTVAPVGQG